MIPMAFCIGPYDDLPIAAAGGNDRDFTGEVDERFQIASPPAKRGQSFSLTRALTRPPLPS
jgi:hypothetical protein